LSGKDVKGLSAVTTSHLKERWRGTHARWQQQDLSAKRHMFSRVDGCISIFVAMARCQYLLIIVGVDAQGFKEFLVIENGYRESE
jgi:hypothetical protein